MLGRNPRTTSWLDFVWAFGTLAVAIGLSMLWNKWRERRAARRKDGGIGNPP
jgi:hypothetical protein